MDFFRTALVTLWIPTFKHSCRSMDAMTPLEGVNAVLCIALERLVRSYTIWQGFLPTSDLHECKNG